MRLFALQGSKDFGEAIAKHLHIPLSQHEEREFEDGEHKARPLVNVQRQEVFVIHSLYSDARQSVNDKLCRLLFFIGALKDAGAARVTAVLPYLCYARKDRRTKPGDPVTTRYVARMLQTAGADVIITMDVHNLQAYQNAFTIPAENLEARELFAAHLVSVLNGEEPVIMSPDFGGAKRAEQFMESMNALLNRNLAFVLMEKYRSSGMVWGEKIAGDVRGKTVIILDDMISTGGTIARAAAACQKSGASKVIALATHGLFTGKAGEILQEPALQQIIITNTIPPFRLAGLPVKEKLMVLDATPLFAEAIRKLAATYSPNEQFEIEPYAGTK